MQQQPTIKPPKKLTPELNKKISQEYIKKLCEREKQIINNEFKFKSFSAMIMQYEQRLKITKSINFLK